MATTYARKRAQFVRSKRLKPEKVAVVPKKEIPVVINDKLTVFISDESKREETILKYKSA